MREEERGLSGSTSWQMKSGLTFANRNEEKAKLTSKGVI